MIWPLLAALAVGALALRGKGSSSQTPPPGSAPSDWHDAIAAALASGDPKRMRDLADKLEADGYIQAAADLRSNASLAAAGQSTGVAVHMPGMAPPASVFNPHTVPGVPLGVPQPIPQAPPTTSVPTPPPGAPPNGYEQALAIARHLASTGRGKENVALVKAFEKAHGLTPDGKYGANDAAQIANFGIVPPTPFYWPKLHTATRMKQYKQFLLDKASSDPAQAALWIDAANKVKV